MTSDADISGFRAEAELPPFTTDIFISYRFGDDGNPKLRNLASYLEERFGVEVTTYGAPLGRLKTVQKETVRSSRVVIVLLEQSKGLYNPRDDGAGSWGQQYEEIAAVAELDRGVSGVFGSDGAWKEELVLPVVLVFYFYSDGPDDPASALAAMLPTDHPDKPPKMDGVRDYLASVGAWKAELEAVARDPNAGWHRDAVNGIAQAFRKLGRTFSTGKCLSQAGADELPPAPEFDHAAYVRRRREFWEEGLCYIPQDETAADRAARGSFRVGPRERIRLSALLQRYEIPDTLEEIDDARAKLVTSEGSLWVLGQPGAGKTTVITQAAAAEAAARGGRLPLVFELKRFFNKALDGEAQAIGPLPALMAQDIAETGDPCTADMLSDFVKNRPCTIYLDGFDELSDVARELIANRIKQARGEWPQTRLIISCRAGYEGDHLDRLSKLRLRALSIEDLDSFLARRTEHLSAYEISELDKNLKPLRKAFLHRSGDADALRTPFFLMLILNDDTSDGALSGSASMIYATALSRVFKRLQTHADAQDLKDFDVVEALTPLAVAHLENRLIDDGHLAEVARGESRGTTSEMKELRNRRLSFLRKQSAILRRDDANGHYTFTHAIFAEYLVALSLALAWQQASLIHDARRERERAEREILDRLLGPEAGFGEISSLELIERIPCIFLDAKIFSDLQEGPDESEASLLASEFCSAVAQRVRDIEFDRERGGTRGARIFLGVVRAVQGVSDRKYGMRRVDLDRCLELIQSVYRSRAREWRPREREEILSAIAALDVASWEAISGAAKPPVLLAAGNVRVPVWAGEGAREMLLPQLAIERKPVLVCEYREFTLAPDRYDHAFWPGRTEDEKEAAELDFIRPLREGHHEAVGANCDAKFCVIGDLSRTEFREHWREQQRFTHRPVTNIAWREAVAYALWLSKRTGRDLQLPGFAEWSQIAAALTPLGADEAPPVGRGESLVNDGAAGLYSPSTIGVFPPNRLELLDFGSNISIWLAPCDGDFNTVWPPNQYPGYVYFSGGSYLTSRNEKGPQGCYRRNRQSWIGMWLIERS